MRQLILIASLVGLFMYTGFALEFGSVPVGHGLTLSPERTPVESPGITASPTRVEEMDALEQALKASGTELDRILLTGWVETAGSDTQERVQKALGWETSQAGDHELRELKLHHREGQVYLSVRWELAPAQDWASAQTRLRQALDQAGPDSMATVQLQGWAHVAPVGSHDQTGAESPEADPVALTRKVLDALKATQREHWSGYPAASAAGRTALLPPSPFGVNVQVAVRYDAAAGRSQVWVAWPALLQEY